jgi:hypothetical protein
MSEWPYTPRPVSGEPITTSPPNNPSLTSDEQFLTAAQHMAEAEHVREVRKGAHAHKLRKTVEELPAEPFLVTLYFRTGLTRSFWVTKFETVDDDEGRATDATWEQKDPNPGDELLQFLDWSEVIMATTAAVEKP